MLKCDACNPVTNDWNCFTKHTKVSCKNSKLNLTAEKATQTEPIATATKATTNNHSTQAEIKQTEQKVAKHCQVKSYGSNMKKSESVAQLQVKPKYHAKEKPSKNHHMRKKSSHKTKKKAWPEQFSNFAFGKSPEKLKGCGKSHLVNNCMPINEKQKPGRFVFGKNDKNADILEHFTKHVSIKEAVFFFFFRIW